MERVLQWAGRSTGQHPPYPRPKVLCFRRLFRYLRCLSRFRSIVALMMVAFWLPSSSHAWLQMAGLIHSDHSTHSDSDHDDSDDSDEHGGGNHDLADGLCRTEVGSVSVLMPNAHFAYVSNVAFLWSFSATLEADPNHSGPSPPGTSPPELSHRWQFSFRTALPARAPSFVS